jgi:F0F1-type ATP synthase membrane subunit b/b'
MNIVHTILNSPETLGAVALGLVIGMIVLLFLQARSSSQISKLTFPAYEYTIKKAQNEADKILGEAREKAREIIVNAETESQSVLKARVEESTKDYEAYVSSLEELKEDMRGLLRGTAEETRNRSEEISRTFISHLESQDAEMQQRIRDLAGSLEGVPAELRERASSLMEGLQERIARAGEQLEHTLLSSHEDNQKEIHAHFQKGFEEAEREIASYREGRKALIDKHIETLVKDVVRVTLQKELTRPDHAELVRSALEEAKSEGSL